MGAREIAADIERWTVLGRACGFSVLAKGDNNGAQ
jgi:hypothetical protein